MSLLTEFPKMGRTDLRDFKKSIDEGFRDFTKNYGEAIENFFDPLLYFLVWLEKLFLNTPWPIIMASIALLVYFGSKSIKLTIGAILAFLLIGYLDMWEDTMATLAIISVATIVCISVGIPIGIMMARSNRTQTVVTPILDIMQTIPSFVYQIGRAHV